MAFLNLSINIKKRKLSIENINEFANPKLATRLLKKQAKRSLELWNTLGSIYLKKGELINAKQILNTALEYKTKIKEKHLFLSTYIKLGELYIEQGEFDKVEEILKNAIEYKPKNINMSRYIQALLTAGDCHFHQKKLSTAIQFYQQAIKYALDHSLIYLEYKGLSKLCICLKELNEEKEFATIVFRFLDLLVQLSKKGGSFMRRYGDDPS